MIKAVIFDLDGTLLNRDSSLQSFVANQYDRFATSLGHIERQSYIRRFIELDCRGHVWKDKVYQSLIEEFEIAQVSWQFLLDDYETKFINHCVPFPYLIDTINLLKQQDYLLGMITNGRTIFQSRSIQGLGIEKYFNTIVISEAEQIRKPQPEIFHIALSKLKTTAKTSVYIGDNPQADVVGAKKADLKAIWKRNQFWSEPTEADAVINELDEILPILKQWKNC
ncbi:HAD-superfamily hydrolase, subfamily IA, variant 1 [Hyella patelloides LEGE 07179]|uniref:HAD-superfamily hydrolase, subfamily IA, variant 1 n=1 Tax=Hyella patelloides LEGE 07179 TaxID=945734 RepID=A0A563VZ39_9CYAN|nr:HAD family hydrolase [Hyella patelloides]VEP16689.1 HAD-superfamily hydrolase, subfamily IA, variant 1 [Hyella patelloides LEGE 07179]